MANIAHNTQQLGGITSYDDMTGYVRTRTSEPGLAMRFYWGGDFSWQDISGSWPDLRAKLGTSFPYKHKHTYSKHIHALTHVHILTTHLNLLFHLLRRGTHVYGSIQILAYLHL